MDTVIALVIAAAVSLFFLLGYLRKLKKRDRQAREAAAKGQLYSEGPRAQHPHIDTTYCIGCATCTQVCPEGDVLAMLAGKAVIVNGHKCIGHSLCADACPVGAITMVMASPSMGADMPYLSPEFETTIPNLFIVGELGGLALIKNAVNQGRDCIDIIAGRLASSAGPRRDGVFDVLIVGSGPAGISASLRAIELQLNYVTIERDEVGGTVAKYPRQKLVMTSPVQFPTYGRFKKMQLSKEELIAFWHKILQRADFNVRTGEAVTEVQRDSGGIFTVITSKDRHCARSVVLALGRAGTPRKLGVPGEELPKVMYRLIEADHYVNKRILIVGGGDSAVEAAMGLAHQVGNEVTLCYRQDRFSRIKERNAVRIEECVRSGKVKVLFHSQPVEIGEGAVLLDVKGERRQIANDYVWIFAGGIPPNDFLKTIGVGFGPRDMTQEASQEARQDALARTQMKAQPQNGTAAPGDDLPEASPPQPAGHVTLPAPARQGQPLVLRTPAPTAIPGADLAKVARRLLDAQSYDGMDILVSGSSETAIQTALALGHGKRNRVTLSLPGDNFHDLQPRYRMLIENSEAEKVIRVVRNSSVTEITPDSVILDFDGSHVEIPNDHVFLVDSETSPRDPFLARSEPAK